MFQNQLMQMPAPGTSSFIGPVPGHFFVQKPWGWAHISVQKPWGAGGMGKVKAVVIHCSLLLHDHEEIHWTFLVLLISAGVTGCYIECELDKWAIDFSARFRE